MRWPTLTAPMPLLGKELIEQASRKRTYVLRFVCAALLFFLFGLFAWSIFERTDYGLAQIGRGRQLFEPIVYILFVGILIFQPALMACVLTYEKERQSMALLVLTDLRPREILLQKYVSRLIPMVTILLLSMPLLGLSYAYGGVETSYLLAGIYILLITCLQVGALALLCSSFCRTSLGAFLASYLLGALYYLGVPFLFVLLELWWRFGGTDFAPLLGTFMPVFLFAQMGMGWRFGGLGGPGVSLWYLGLQSLGVLASIGVFLVLARLCLMWRAFVTPRNELLQVFRLVDRAFNAVNKGFGGVVLVRDRDGLPTDEPIAWREVSRKSLGKARYLFRVLVVLEVPVLLFALFCLMMRPTGEPGVLSLWLMVVWVLAALAVTVTSANTIVAERIHQTLEALLTTPIAGAEIIRQKMRGVRRLVGVLLIPLLSIFLLEAWWRGALRSNVYGYEEWGWGTYLVASVLTAVVYLPMLSWLSLWISLKSRTRFRAILTALMVVVGWIAIPWLLAAIVSVAADDNWLEETPGLVVMLSSPATMVVVAEFGPPRDQSMPVLIALNTLGYAGVWLLFRTLCLSGADRLLGRVPSREEAPP